VQSFPRHGWEQEFPLAAEIGFASIELTIEMASWDIHPIRTDVGRSRLAELSTFHGIALAGLCRDTVMEYPLLADDSSALLQGRDMLFDVIENGAEAGLPMIELPMLGVNSLAQIQAPASFEVMFDDALERAAILGIDILLETDLDGPTLAAFMGRHDHPRLGVNYDTGNSTWFGFDPDEELPIILPFIRNVHIKDCTKADYSVPLGKGETAFKAMFTWLAKGGYHGAFILQAARQPDDVAAARDYLSFTRNLIHGHLGGPR
jgi:hexulose-6-phosphate isomerase